MSSNLPIYREKRSLTNSATPASKTYENDYCLPHGISTFDFSVKSPLLSTQRAPLEMIAAIRLVRKETSGAASSKQKGKGNIKELNDLAEYKLNHITKDKPETAGLYASYYFFQLHGLAD